MFLLVVYIIIDLQAKSGHAVRERRCSDTGGASRSNGVGEFMLLNRNIYTLRVIFALDS